MTPPPENPTSERAARRRRRGWAALLVEVLRSPWPRLGLLLVLLGASAALAGTHGAGMLSVARGAISGMGPAGWVVFVLVYAVATVILFPDSLLSAAAGLLFGPLAGVVLVWCGAMLGALASFLLGRALSREAVERLAGGRIDRLNAFLARRGVVSVLLVRLVPLFPFGLVNYGSAVTAVTVRQYVVGTGVGMLPGIVVYVVLGASVTSPASAAFWISGAALLALAAGGALAARLITRRTARGAASG